MSESTTCPYDCCDKPGTEHDSDGDLACTKHAAMSMRYTVIEDLSESPTWLDLKGAAIAECWLHARGWDVRIREPWTTSEAVATYRHDRGGLQILGFSLPVPEALREALRKAGEFVIETGG
jgi:hypothetical protein